MKRITYILLLQIGIILIINLSVLASDKIGYPQENVKLTGQFFTYPIGIEGSPYMHNDWQNGNILLEDGKTAYNIKIQFNIITNNLVFYNESLKRIFIADKGTIKSFVMSPGSNDSLYFIKYVGNDVGYKLKNEDFIHILNQGKVVFFVKHTADVIDATEANSKDKVFPKDQYFISYNNETSEVKIKYKSVYSLFPTKKKEIKKIISENRLRKVSLMNFVKLLQLINEAPEI